MKYNLFLLILALCSIVPAMGATFEVNGIVYNVLYGDKVEVTTRSGISSNPKPPYEGNIVIPSKVTFSGKEYDVVAIGPNAFSGSTSLASVSIPESVTSIEWAAFMYCSGLTELKLPSTLTKLGANSLWGTGIKTIDIPAKLEVIEHGTFIACENLESIVIPDNIKQIEYSVFQSCKNLKHIKIGKGLTQIGAYDLQGTMANQVFYGCTSIESIEISEDNPTFFSPYVESEKAWSNAIIKKSDMSLVAGSATTVIPDGVKVICEQAFCGLDIQSVRIPASVTRIEKGAFYDCWSLKYIYTWNTNYDILKRDFGTDTKTFVVPHELYLDYIKQGFKKVVIDHPVVKTDAVPATCTTAGNSTYYTCTYCALNFSDATAYNKIEKDSWIVPALQHSFTNYIYQNDATYDADGHEIATCDRTGCDATDRRVKSGTKLDRPTPVNDASTSEIPSPRKAIVNGRLVIISGGVTYSLEGKVIGK